MLAVAFAAATALVWGIGDFFGGKASQRSSSLHVATVAMLTAVALLLLALLAYPVPLPPTTDLGWGALAGLALFTGLVVFYRGLASGAMSVVAPVAAVTSASLPFVVGLVIDRTPGFFALVGAGLAVVAIGLVSMGHDSSAGTVTGRIVVMALISGAMFGLCFVLLKQVSPLGGTWSLLVMRLSALVMAALLLARRRQLPRLAAGSWRWAVPAGVLDVAANVFFLAAVHRGALSVVGPVAAMYPAATVLLALVVDKERLRPIQVAGLSLAVAALVLTAV